MGELIRYANGVTVEVASSPNAAVPVRDAAAQKAAASFESAIRTLEPLLRPIQETVVKVVSETFSEAEIKLGLAFTAEGNLFVTKASAEANLEITLTFKRPEKQP